MSIDPTSFPTGEIKINGLSVSYYQAGSAETPIIFIHGFPFNKSCWMPQLSALSEKHRVIAYDIRGFGDSGPGQENFSIDLFAGDLVAFMDALQIKKAIVAGLSMGGYILMNAVSRFPGRFAGLILCDTQCIADSEEGKAKRYKTIDEINKNGLTEFSNQFVQSVFGDTTKKEKPELVKEISTLIQKNSAAAVTGTLAALAERKESCSHLKKINIPALIICGKEDKLTPVTQSEFLFNNLTGSKLKIIEGAGHLSNLEQPEAFNAAVSDFAVACDKAAAA